MSDDWFDFWDDDITSLQSCPECGGATTYRVDCWEASSGKPVDVSFDCFADVDLDHYYRQSDWQAIRDAMEVEAVKRWRIERTNRRREFERGE